MSEDALKFIEKHKVPAVKAYQLSRLRHKEDFDKMCQPDNLNRPIGEFTDICAQLIKGRRSGIRQPREEIIPIPKSKKEMLEIHLVAKYELDACPPDAKDYLRLRGRLEMIQEILSLDPATVALRKQLEETERTNKAIEKRKAEVQRAQAALAQYEQQKKVLTQA